MTLRLQEFEDHYFVPLGGVPIGLIQVDFRLTFIADVLHLVCETGFTIEDGEHSDWVDPTDLATILPAIKLFNRRLESVLIYKNGMLRLHLEDGARLRVLPHESYEAWNLSGEGGLMMVCMPGGEVAVWSTPEQRSIEWLPGRKPSDPT
jgi:hypothetical protein